MYWRRPNGAGERLLVPELRQVGRPLLYSFRDVIALRTFGSYYPGVTADAALDAASFADEVSGIAS